MTSEPVSYRRHRFPAAIISHAVSLFHVFSLSLRDVELILAERGVSVTHESIRAWRGKFGTEFAKRLRKRRPKRGDVWHLDEVFIRMNGTLHYLWRAIDQHGVVLNILVQGRRNADAARRFFKRLLQGVQYKPRRLVTDGLRSYGAAQRAIMPEVRHRISRYLNNRAENSHRPTRRRERQMQKFKSPAQAQRFLSAHGMIYGHFHPPTCDDRRRLPAGSWQDVPGLATGNVRPVERLITPRLVCFPKAAFIHQLDHARVDYPEPQGEARGSGKTMAGLTSSDRGDRNCDRTDRGTALRCGGGEGDQT